MASGDKKYASRNEWAAQYFKISADTGRYLCVVEDKDKKKCGHSFGKKTAKQNWVEHLLAVHKMSLPKQFTAEGEGDKKKQSLIAPFLFKRDPSVVQAERLVVAYCMNARVAFSTMDEKYWKAAHSASHPPGLRSRSQLTKQILDYASKLEVHRMAMLHGKAVGLQLDGGKDVNKRKLLVTCVVVDGMSLLHKVHDTELATLDDTYYKNHVQSVLQELEACGACVVSITVDNEASPNSGISKVIDELVQNDCPLHFRCGAHTLELTLASVATAFPWIEAGFRTVEHVFNVVRNHKVLLKSLATLQKTANVHSNSWY